MIKQRLLDNKMVRWLGKIFLSTYPTIHLFICLSIHLTICLLLFLSTCLYAAFKDGGWGTRPAGMGGAFVALADDSNATLWNPAGVSAVEEREISFMYAKLFAGLDGVNLEMNYLSLVMPMDNNLWGLGLSWSTLRAANLYREDTVGVSVSKSLNDFININTGISIGITVKYLLHKYTLDYRSSKDSLFIAHGTSRENFGLDAGVLIQPPKEKIRLGFMAKNINEPDMGLKDKDLVPVEFRFGGTYLGIARVTPSIEVSKRRNDINVHIGAEVYVLSNILILRTGGNLKEATFGFSFSQKITKKLGFRIDYAFIWPIYIEDSFGTHRTTMSVRF